LGSDTERKTIQGINPTEPQIISPSRRRRMRSSMGPRGEEFGHRTFEPFNQFSSLRWWHRRDLLVVQFERGRPPNLFPAPSFHWLVGIDGLAGCPIQRRQSIRFSCPAPRYRAESVLGVRPAV